MGLDLATQHTFFYSEQRTQAVRLAWLQGPSSTRNSFNTMRLATVGTIRQGSCRTPESVSRRNRAGTQRRQEWVGRDGREGIYDRHQVQ
eukprot:364995-Chlamydomonas_euryale.AAC.6